MPRPEARSLSFHDTMLSRARRMRREPTPSEAILWGALRGKQLGVKFRRQHVIHPFIVDFCAPSAHLVVEVDGTAHAGDELHYDARRDAFLQRAGYRVLRVKAWLVTCELEVVLSVVRAAL